MRTYYVVRQPDKDGGPYGPTLPVDYENLRDAQDAAEYIADDTSYEMVYIDRIIVTENDYHDEWGKVTLEDHNIDGDFYAELFRGEWLIEEGA